jgi:hypothetical protein
VGGGDDIYTQTYLIMKGGDKMNANIEEIIMREQELEKIKNEQIIEYAKSRVGIINKNLFDEIEKVTLTASLGRTSAFYDGKYLFDADMKFIGRLEEVGLSALDILIFKCLDSSHIDYDKSTEYYQKVVKENTWTTI